MATNQHPARHLGGLEVSQLGLGCMGMTQSYGTPDDASSFATLERALELGITFWDTAEAYGPFANEELVGKAMAGKRDRITIATKFGFKFNPGAAVGSHIGGVDGSPANVKRACEGSLKRLGVETIDLFYQHRKDPAVPIEETVGAMAELVSEGKVRFLGLSEVGPDTIRRAHAVHPIAALQSEYSLWERGIEERIIPTLRELGIGLVPFSPLGRGFLTGTVATTDGLPDNDFRRRDPRFAEENIKANEASVEIVKAVGAKHGATPAQIALAWLLAQGDDVAPIPGTKRVKYLEDNAGARDVNLDDDDMAKLNAIASRTAGPRYQPAMMAMVER